MTYRETTWDEEDTTSPTPLLPGELGSQITAEQATNEFVNRIYREGVSQQILEMCEERITINKVIEAIPTIRQEGEKLIVPVLVEKMVLVKKTVLVEEIVLWPKEPPAEDC